MTKYFSGLTFFLLAAVSQAAEPAWVPVTTELLQREKTGFGGLCGVVVDHGSGDVWLNLSDRGMFHSADQGKTWKQVSDTQPKGRTETPGCWLLDPTGKSQRMVTALVYGAPISVSSDRAATWKSLHNASSHIDWCAVDWTDPELRFVLALKHEAGGLLLASNDGGQSFVEVGKGHGPGWVFDNQTAIVAEVQDNKPPRLLRTTDGGRTFQPCGDFRPVGRNSAQALPKWRDGTLYWLAEDGLIATTDKGKAWKQLSLVKDAQYGPIFGSDAKHMFVLTKAGPVESTDGGLTWSPPLAPPQEMQGIGGLSWLEYDPQHDTLYLMKMGSDLYRLTRGADPRDTTSVQGNWTPVKAELAGRPLPETVLKTIRLKLGDGTYEVSGAGKPDKGTYELDSSAKPKTMLITGTDGPNKGKRFPAIYELNGETLRICYDLSGAKYPTQFKSIEGTQHYLVTYHRVK